MNRQTRDAVLASWRRALREAWMREARGGRHGVEITSVPLTPASVAGWVLAESHGDVRLAKATLEKAAEHLDRLRKEEQEEEEPHAADTGTDRA